MRKTRIKVRANIAARVDAWEITQLIANDWHNITTELAASDVDDKVDSLNVELLEFGIQTKTSITSHIQEMCYRWTIGDFIKYSNYL